MEIHRRTAIVLSCSPFALIGLVALWYGWVNFKAAREANALLARLEKNGHPTVVEDLYPPVENPDEAMMHHPAMIAELALPDGEKLDRINRRNYGSRIAGMNEGGIGSYKAYIGQFPDVRNYFDPVRHGTQQEAAAELLAALAPEIARVDALLEAFARPVAGWTARREPGGPDELDDFHWEYYFAVFRTSEFIGEVAMIYLMSGNPDVALRYIDGLCDIHRHCVAPPNYVITSIFYSMMYSRFSLLIQCGMAHGLWEDRHLAALAEKIEKITPEVTFIAALGGEITFAADYLRQMVERKISVEVELYDDWDLDFDDIKERLDEFRALAAPRGTYLLHTTQMIEWMWQQVFLENGKPRTGFELHEFEAITRKAVVGDEGAFNSNHFGLLRDNVINPYFEVQITQNLLITGIALERHRLAHGVHPESLAALVPEFLNEVPQDPCDGQPLRYRLQRDGLPVVWSIGIDGIDESGKPHHTQEEGDRVWVTKPLEGFDEKELRR